MKMGGTTFLNASSTNWKKKNHWKFSIQGVVDCEQMSVSVLPPSRTARPNISFKEQAIEHLNETIYVPMKPDWGTVDLSLFDIRCNRNPIFEWLKMLYSPRDGRFTFPIEIRIPEAELSLVNGCGDVVESWVYEGVWPQKIEFGELDMGSSEIVMVDVTLRYERAYITN